ncbi:MAG: TPM domain-containing protein [Pseudomonadales bacterium]|nr:TPM domain-containing protein [Pseudomonadales bacterium]
MVTVSNRYLQNLFTTSWALRRAFPQDLLDAIERAVGDSERQHSGELRFAIETALDVPALLRGSTARDRAIEAFSQLRTWDTAQNNGVLIYLLLSERDIEIVADRGFSDKVSTGEWQSVCKSMQRLFHDGRYREGALQGIEQVTTLMNLHFPPDSGDINELPDKPVLL